MKKFAFSLQKILEYREHLEGDAKKQYLECKSKKDHEEHILHQIRLERSFYLSRPCHSVDSFLTKELYPERSEAEESMQEATLTILSEEEQNAYALWVGRKRELESMKKLCKKQEEQWIYNANRIEQTQIDELSLRNLRKRSS